MLALSTHIASSLRACSKLRVSPSAPCRVLFSRHPSFQTATRHFSRTPIRQEDLPREQYRSSNSSKPIYPSRLLIYHAGTQKTTFISFWKVTSFFLFGISCGLLAPRFFYAHDESQPVLKAIGVMCLGAIPLLILGVATAPFVNSISLHIPQHARRSRKGLMQYVKNLPRDAQLEFVTIRLIGLQKTTGVMLSDMRVLPDRWGRLANLERVKSARFRKEQAERPLWKRAFGFLAEPRFKFYVKNDVASMKRSRAPGVWASVLDQIHERS